MKPGHTTAAFARFAIAIALPALASPLAAQDAAGFGEVRPTALLRPGFAVEPEISGRGDGFVLYDARLGVVGRVAGAFDVVLGVEYDRSDPGVDLLDAHASFGLAADRLELSIGAAPMPIGFEATTDRANLRFVERSQAMLALAPGRQLGLRLEGTALDTRLRFGAGLFNGGGVALDNADGGFQVGGRVTYNNVGDIEFAEDFVVEIGATAAFASDSGVAVLPVGGVAEDPPGAPVVALREFQGDRLTWGGSARLAYQGWTLAGEFLRTDYDPASGPDRHAEGIAIDVRHALWGLLDVGARYDAFTPTASPIDDAPAARRFLVFGVGLAPALMAEVRMQYAVGFDDPGRGAADAIDGTNTAPPLADGQFLIYLQAGL